MSETFIPVAGFGGRYVVSDRGRVMSVRGRTMFELRGANNTCGYKQVELYGPLGGVKFLVHRLVAAHHLPNPERAPLVDHIDRDTQNNDKLNLRSASQNQHNRAPNRVSTSSYKGVGWVSTRRMWRARITVNGAQRHLGFFYDEVAAARAYNDAARRLHGAFARLNAVPEA